MNRSHLTFLVLIVLFLGLAATAAVIASIPPAVRPERVAAVSPAAMSLAERRFYQLVVPELTAAAGEASELARLGQERSRNLFAIRAGQGRLEAHLETLDGLLGESAVPERFSSVAAAYHPAAAAVREAMTAAEAAFLRFDWDGVGAATERMAEGTRQLEAAAAALDQATRSGPGLAPP